MRRGHTLRHKITVHESGYFATAVQRSAICDTQHARCVEARRYAKIADIPCAASPPLRVGPFAAILVDIR